MSQILLFEERFERIELNVERLGFVGSDQDFLVLSKIDEQRRLLEIQQESINFLEQRVEAGEFLAFSEIQEQKKLVKERLSILEEYSKQIIVSI